MNVEIQISQGIQKLDFANINIIIDVIRAFTVSHYAFLSGAQKIQLIDTVENGLMYKDKHDNCILSGEINAYKIEEFDYGNSPYDISNVDLSGKILAQKTTNGVAATLKSLQATYIFVTGFTNYFSTVKKVRNLINISDDNKFNINIIASHPTGDEDLACAELIKESLLYGNNIDIKRKEEMTINRILRCAAAEKFLDPQNKQFSIMDIALCINPIKSNFIMEVEYNGKGLPIINKKELK